MSRRLDLRVDVARRMIEEIGGVDAADIRLDLHFLSRRDSGAEHFKISCRGNDARQVVSAFKAGVRRCGHRDDDVAAVDTVGNAARGTDADDRLDAEEIKKLKSIERQRRHPHAGTHDGNFLTVVFARIAEHGADVIEKHRILKISLRDVFRAERIARHQDAFRDVRALLDIDAG